MDNDLNTPSEMLGKNQRERLLQTEKAKAGEPLMLKVDDTIKVLFNSDNRLLIEFINNALGTDHDPDTSTILNTDKIFHKIFS